MTGTPEATPWWFMVLLSLVFGGGFLGVYFGSVIAITLWAVGPYKPPEPWPEGLSKDQQYNSSNWTGR